ncbi:hypothetical protein M3J07_006545 [Ascochyta lentis]
MSTPIRTLLASFKDSTDLVEVHDSYTQMSVPPSRHMRKSQVADYFTTSTQPTIPPHSTPAILLPRLPATGTPPQIAQHPRVRNNNALLSQPTTADPLWLARRMLGKEMFMSPSYCLEFDTYYLVEEGTVCITQGTRPLTAQQRKMVDDDQHVFRTLGFAPVMQFLSARGEVGVLLVPAFTVHQVVLQSDALMTVGCFVPEGELGGCEKGVC